MLTDPGSRGPREELESEQFFETIHRTLALHAPGSRVRQSWQVRPDAVTHLIDYICSPVGWNPASNSEAGRMEFEGGEYRGRVPLN